MLSESSKVSDMPTGNYAPLAEPRTVRLSFKKKGRVIYTSHLDLQRTMMRILARADLPLWYTQGFNPHAKLVFGLPLPLGCAGERELMDIKIQRDMPSDEILERMRRATVPGIEFTECYPAEEKYAGIAAASYNIILRLPKAQPASPADLASPVSAAEAEEFLRSRPIVTLKKTKSGEAQTDISPLIRSVAVREVDGCLVIDALLAAGSNENLSCELLVGVLVSHFGSRALNNAGLADYSVTRTDIYRADGSEFR